MHNTCTHDLAEEVAVAEATFVAMAAMTIVAEAVVVATGVAEFVVMAVALARGGRRRKTPYGPPLAVEACGHAVGGARGYTAYTGAAGQGQSAAAFGGRTAVERGAAEEKRLALYDGVAARRVGGRVSRINADGPVESAATGLDDRKMTEKETPSLIKNTNYFSVVGGRLRVETCLPVGWSCLRGSCLWVGLVYCLVSSVVWSCLWFGCLSVG